MELWVLVAVAAAAFQTVRFMLQKQLSMGSLSVGGATFSRFFYSVPFISALSFGYAVWRGIELPSLSATFWVYALSGGLAQILATWCVVALFQQRSFAVGITFKKTEVLLTALVGLIVLGDRVSLSGVVAILIGLIGVLILSQKPEQSAEDVWSNIASKGTILGLLSGILFAISAVTYRGATLEIASADPLFRSSVALCVVTLCQTIGMMVWLKWQEPGEIGRVIAARRSAVWMGVTGMAGSLGWFTAFTLQNAAYVFAVGQVEVIFSIAASALFFREIITRKELVGILFITASVVALVVVA